MDYFVLQAKEKLKEDQQAYAIPGIRDVYGKVVDMVWPTDVSVELGLLEWLIPNNAFNQHWISRHYSHFKIIEKETGLAPVTLMPGMPEPQDFKEPEVSEVAEKTEDELKKEAIEELKRAKHAELSELGIKAPKNSSLKKLDKLIEEASKEEG